MHRINANRVSNEGTSASLDDSSIQRIQARVKGAAQRRAVKHQKESPISKTAKIKPSNPDTGAEDNTKRIIVASLGDIPAHFERIGTGFFREGHHLWEIAPGKGGFILTRKHGEDHVLGYDPEPIKKESSVIVTDRFGRELKTGQKVRLPLRGKVATGTIVVLTPGSMDVGLDGGGQTSCPPGMAEFIEEEKGEDEHSPETIEALESFVEEEMSEEEHGDKEAGDAFEPEIEDKPKSDYVGPQSSQSGGIGGVANKKIAQTEEPSQTVTTEPTAPAVEPSFPEFEPGEVSSRLAEYMDDTNFMVIKSPKITDPYTITKIGDDKFQIGVLTTRQQQLDEVDRQGLIEFERQLGDWSPLSGLSSTGNHRQAQKLYNEVSTISGEASVDLKTWKEYWKSVGARVAQAAPKPPKPKMTEEEKKQKRKERAKQRKIERAGLPKGVKLPPKPKEAAKDTEELAKLKELIRIYEQGVDELEYALNTVSDPSDDVLVADELTRVLEGIAEEKAKLEEEEEEEREKDLSLEEPADIEITTQARRSEKLVVSMSDL